MESTYSPPFTEFVPKLEPIVPVHVQDFPAALVHLAVATTPGFKQPMAERLGGTKKAMIEDNTKAEGLILLEKGTDWRMSCYRIRLRAQQELYSYESHQSTSPS